MLNWFKDRVADSPSVVMTAPGVFKTHNVEAKFRTEEGRMLGKLGQDRWSDGQERFSMRLRGLPGIPSGPIRLFRGSEQVSEFDHEGGSFEFRWKGEAGIDIPRFEIGDLLTVEVGDVTFTATVQAD